MSVEESDLLSDVNLFCWNAEVLAMERLHAIELPLCGFLTRCSAKDCNDLLVSIFFFNFDLITLGVFLLT